MLYPSSEQQVEEILKNYDAALKREPQNVELAKEISKARRWLREDGSYAKAPSDDSLVWLARVQRKAGHWTYDNSPPKGKGDTVLPWNDPSNLRATSLAVLCFIAVGKTTLEGEFKSNVEAGIDFIISEARISDSGVDLRGPGGDTTAHAQALLAICEEFAANEQPHLRAIAQKAVAHLESSQLETGGWRDGQDGKANVITTAWSVFALQAAVCAEMKVSRQTLERTTAYLDKLAIDDGANYARDLPERPFAATAAGLLCRMLLGWDKDHPAVKRGTRLLIEKGPITTDVESIFFTHQVAYRLQGAPWREWNLKQRDFWPNSQIQVLGNKGSWHFPDEVAATSGGSIYHTSIGILSLATYYRYLRVHRFDQAGLAKILQPDKK